MKTVRWIPLLPLSFVFLMSVALARAEGGAPGANLALLSFSADPPELVRETSTQPGPTELAFAHQLTPIAATTSAPVDAATAPAGVLTLAPVVVRTTRSPELAAPRENRVEEFFRTGTFLEQVGRKVTSRLWARGDQGVMLSFSW
jgi:hypothetical protein